jgi:hypothetical protein
MVMEVSATLVETTIFRTPPEGGMKTRFCSCELNWASAKDQGQGGKHQFSKLLRRAG